MTEIPVVRPKKQKNNCISANILIKNRVGRQVRVGVFKAIFNNISVISWQSVLLVEETGNH
jgi:hypothetical protein